MICTGVSDSLPTSALQFPLSGSWHHFLVPSSPCVLRAQRSQTPLSGPSVQASAVTPFPCVPVPQPRAVGSHGILRPPLHGPWARPEVPEGHIRTLGAQGRTSAGVGVGTGTRGWPGCERAAFAQQASRPSGDTQTDRYTTRTCTHIHTRK